METLPERIVKEIVMGERLSNITLPWAMELVEAIKAFC